VADFVLRRGESADLDAVVALIGELAEFEKLPGPDAAAQARFRADAAAGRFELDVAERGGEVVAYAVSFAMYSTFLARPTLYLEDVYVRPDARKRGIATAMMRRLAARAVERGCGRFEWTVLDWNHHAQRLYESLGARVLKQWWTCRVDGEALVELGK
jgi:GNAT superfamily N-acetyltransferase